MIDDRKRLMNRLEAVVRLDKDDPTVLHIDFDNLIRVLGQFGFVIRPNSFEKRLMEVLNEHVVDKAKVHPQLTRHVIATIIHEVAVAMNLARNDLVAAYAHKDKRDILNKQ